ncbi:MAG: type I restriction endonuclease subunit R [Candidatus Reddybacter sp.]
MQKFDEAQLENAIITLLGEQGFPHSKGAQISRKPEEVLIKEDLHDFLALQYRDAGITESEISSIIRKLALLSASDLYESNKTFMAWLSNGFLFKREDRSQKDLFIQLIDYSDLALMRFTLPAAEQAAGAAETIDTLNMAVAEQSAAYIADVHCDNNIYKLVNQLEIEGAELRIPDGILYINGLPLVVFEFKSAIREEDATIQDAYEQLHIRYRRDIPQLFVFNALCIISDGVNNKLGNLFAPYDFYYAWRKVTGDESTEREGISSLHTMIQGLFDKRRLRDVIRHFIYFPDVSNDEVKIVCRYPQYYATNKLFRNIQRHQKPSGDGKGGTYFGATGCGKSFTMQFLARLLMKSVHFSSPTIVLITDRTDLDDQLSVQFTNAKKYIGDDMIVSVESRENLRELLQGRQSGGVFLTTIHKFTEDAKLLSDRSNVICISDEAHRSQINLDKKTTITYDDGKAVGYKESYGFATYLHQSLPNATYVGFTGTPIDATLDVFGDPVDTYTMTESVQDEITVRIVYEGRAAKVNLDNSKVEAIEKYYEDCKDAGTNDYQIEKSKKASANMGAILGDPDRIKALAKDFVAHYETRIEEGSTVRGKAMFVSSARLIAYDFYQAVKVLRPAWFEVLACEAGSTLSDEERKEITPSERVKLVMTRGKDDDAALYKLLGDKSYRKALDRQFKNDKSNFKIAIVVDMWLTGFDVPFLDTMYIDKPVQEHNLIQTISRVNRKFSGKEKGLVVDYIGIKGPMNKALAKYSKSQETDMEEISESLVAVRDHLDLLSKVFHHFDSSDYFSGDPVSQLNCLNRAAEYVMVSEKHEKRFMDMVKRLKAAYDICCGCDELTQDERNHVHFYCAVRSIVFKLTKGDAPDTAQMNARVREMISEAIQSEGVEEIYKLGEDSDTAIDIFNDDYMTKISNIKMPNTRIHMLQQLLAKAIGELKKVNKMQGMDFSKRLQLLVEKYNERKENDTFGADFHDEITEEFINMYGKMKDEMNSFEGLGIDFEEKAFYDILKALAIKYDFVYPEDKLLTLAAAVKVMVDDKTQFTDWAKRDDIKAEFKVGLILLLAEHGYPPVDKNEVYDEIFEQAENYKKHAV